MFQSTEDAKRIFSEQLTGKEQVLWASQPKQGIQFKPSDKYLIPFSIIWCGIVVLWELFATSMGEIGTIMAYFGIPFILIGLYLLLGRFFLEAFNRKHIFYALTNRRILVKTGKWNEAIDVYPLKNLGSMLVLENSDGSGNIRFTADSKAISSTKSAKEALNVVAALNLEMIPEVRKVVEQIELAKGNQN